MGDQHTMPASICIQWKSVALCLVAITCASASPMIADSVVPELDDVEAITELQESTAVEDSIESTEDPPPEAVRKEAAEKEKAAKEKAAKKKEKAAKEEKKQKEGMNKEAAAKERSAKVAAEKNQKERFAKVAAEKNQKPEEKIVKKERACKNESKKLCHTRLHRWWSKCVPPPTWHFTDCQGGGKKRVGFKNCGFLHLSGRYLCEKEVTECTTC